MQFINMSDYNRGVSAYWWTSALLGTLTVGYSVIGVLHLNMVGMLEVIALMAVVFLAGLYPIRVPSTNCYITPGDVFIFLTALFFGPAAATLVAVTDAFVASCRMSSRWTSRLGGPALMAIAIFISASLFQLALTWLRYSELLN